MGCRSRRTLRRAPVTVVVGAEAHPSLQRRSACSASAGDVSWWFRSTRRAECVRTQSRADRSEHRLRPGRQREYRRLRSNRRNLPARAADGAWVHVDGAFGLWAAAPSRVRVIVAQGIAEADSWATDAHKWLNVPYDSGLAFVRDRGRFAAPCASPRPILPTGRASRSRRDFTPELSRRARGVDIWAALRSLGRAGLAEMIERNCRHAKRFADRSPLLASGPQRRRAQSGAGLVRRSPEENQRVIAAIQEDGTCWAARRCGRAHRHAHQRFILGNHRGRRGAKS